jgi:hypothetical protein
MLPELSPSGFFVWNPNFGGRCSAAIAFGDPVKHIPHSALGCQPVLACPYRVAVLTGIHSGSGDRAVGVNWHYKDLSSDWRRSRMKAIQRRSGEKLALPRLNPWSVGTVFRRELISKELMLLRSVI